MKRAIGLVVLWCLSIPAASAEPITLTRRIDLNARSALERLRVANPAHYQIIQSILSGLSRHSFYDAPHWIRADFQAKDVFYSFYVLTSYPPQRDLSFTLDSVRYQARVTLMAGGAVVYPRDRTFP